MVRASSGETHWTGERTPGLRGDEGSGDWFSYCPSLAARLRRGVGGSAGCFSRAFTPGRNGKAEKAMSILCEKRSIGPNSPQRRQRKLRGHAGTGPVSPMHLPPSLPLSTPGVSLQGGGPAEAGLAFTRNLPRTGLGPRAQRTDTRNRCQLFPRPGGRGPELPGK